MHSLLQEKINFNRCLFLYYLGLKLLSSRLSRVAVSPDKSSIKNMFSEICLNFKKNLSEVVLNTMSLRTSIKYYGFQNLHKIL